jgi:hypothetical protein
MVPSSASNSRAPREQKELDHTGVAENQGREGDLIQKSLKVYPYVAGAEGKSIAEILTGRSRRAARCHHLQYRSWMVAGCRWNTLPPSDYRFFEMIDRLVEQEPVGALDLEGTDMLASIGIVKGKEVRS